MEQKPESRWEAKVTTKLANAGADQTWPLLADFFNLHKWFPGLSTCYGIHGVSGEPGCVRYCAGFSLPSAGSDGVQRPISWSKERLTSIDPLERSFSYEIVDCNIGFKSYASTVKIVAGGGNEGGGGCSIEWWFAVDPVEGWRFEDLVRKYELGLQQMARKMEAAIVGNLVE